MKFHLLASVFPLLEGDDFETLTESIVPTACVKPLCSILTVRFSMAGTASGPVSKPESNRYDGDDAWKKSSPSNSRVTWISMATVESSAGKEKEIDRWLKKPANAARAKMQKRKKTQ